MSLKTFLNSIGNFFADLFNKTEAAYNTLDSDLQNYIKQGSGIIAIVSANINASSPVVWQLISAAYPNVTQASVAAALSSVLNTLGVISTDLSGNFDMALVTLQEYLAKQKDNTFVVVSKAIVSLLVDAFSPGTVIQKVELVLEYVYQTFIKGKL